MSPKMKTPADVIYRELIENLRSEIESVYGSVKKFGEDAKISRFNLSKIFNYKQDMSLALYARIVSILDTIGRNVDCPDDAGFTMSLRQYLTIDMFAIQQSIMFICFDTNRNVQLNGTKDEN